MSGQIFISYRHEDSSAWAGRLHDHLSARFSQSQIFMDVNMEPGIDFIEAIEKSVSSCDVLVAVIGKHWLTASDEAGRRRLGHPDDFVRTEIATALKRGIRVIPALVDGASMPRSDELPDALKPLARRQALAVSHEHFRIDAGLLVNAVEQALQAAQNPPGPMPSAHQPSPGPTVPHPTARSESSQVYAEIVGPSKIVVGKRAIYRAEFKGDLKFEWQYTQPVTLIDRNVWVELGYPGQTETLTLKVTGPDGRTATASKMLTAIKPEESSHVYAEIVGPSKVFVGKRAIYRAEFEGDLRFEWHYTQPIRLTDRNVWVELGYPGQTETLTLKVTNPDGRTFTTSKTITAVE